MKEIKIKTKKDWCIAFVFTTLIVYVISGFLTYHFQGILLRFGNPMMTNMNQPKSYGNVAFTIVIMTILIEIILFRKRKKTILKVLCPLIGFVLSLAVIAGYFIHVDLIVSSIEKENGNIIGISPWAEEADLTFTKEEEQQIMRLCEQLKPVSKERQRELEKQVLDEYEEMPEGTELIWICYPEHYGHSLDLMVCVAKQSIFVFKGYDNRQKAIITFFEDNGLLKYFPKQ